MKLIGYTRVSTDKQADDGDSLELQRKKLRAYADLHDHELVDIYEDAGISGRDMDRPGLQAALAAAETSEIGGIVVYKLDRLTRSTSDLCDLLERFDGAKSPDLKSVSESLDTSTAGGRMVVRILGVVSEWECETIGERTAQAMQAKAERGEYCGGRPPFGKQVSSDGETLEDNPTEQRALRIIRGLRECGEPFAEIARRLNEQDVPRRNGNDWHEVAVQRAHKAAQEAA